MLKKIRWKYFIIFSLLFNLLDAFYYIYNAHEYEKEKGQHINVFASLISEQIILSFKEISLNKSTAIESAGIKVPYGVLYYVITNNSGNIIKKLNLNKAEQNDYLTIDANRTENLNDNIIKRIYSLNKNEKGKAKLYLGLLKSDIKTGTNNELNNLATISLIIFLSGLLFSALLSGRVYAPVKLLLTAVTDIKKENYSAKIISKRKDEFGKIFKAINSFGDEVELSKGQVGLLDRQIKSLYKDKIGELNFEINQRRHIEEALKQSEEQFRLLVELAPVGMVITSIENIITKVNLSFCETTGYSAEELVGKPISSISNSDDWTRELFLNKSLLKHKIDDLTDWPESTEEDWERKLVLSRKMLTENLSDIYFEKRFIHKNGKIIYAIAKSILLRDSKENPLNFVSQVIDISERKKVENELILAKEKAEASDRLKSAFLAQMSHEIRTPLNVILNITPIVSDELATLKDEDLNTLMDSMDSAGKRLQRTIDLILNMSSIQSGNYEPEFELIDAEKQLKTVIKELKTLCTEKGLELNFDSYIDSPKINADLYTFNQIFQNLIGNAIKYTPKGSITVRIYEEGKEKICIAIKDTGIGISLNYMEKLFTPFSQEDVGQKREFEGNGLGLALVKKYVELNKADIKVESVKNSGSIFTVIFDKPKPN